MELALGVDDVLHLCFLSPRFRHARNRLDACFLLVILFSRPVRQALAFNTLESICRSFPIGHAKAGTIAVAEIKLREVALQMSFADVVVNANDATLENCEVSFDRVAVGSAANVFADAMVNHFVPANSLPRAM
jgi:hypothetical protein